MIKPGSSWHVRFHWSKHEDYSCWVIADDIEKAYNTFVNGLARENIHIPIGAKFLVRHESCVG